MKRSIGSMFVGGVSAMMISSLLYMNVLAETDSTELQTGLYTEAVTESLTDLTTDTVSDINKDNVDTVDESEAGIGFVNSHEDNMVSYDADVSSGESVEGLEDSYDENPDAASDEMPEDDSYENADTPSYLTKDQAEGEEIPNLMASQMESISLSTDLTGQQWWLDLIHAREAWDISRGAGTLVAVIDTGIKTDHKDLQDTIAEAASTFVSSGAQTDGEDQSGHGTAVAGIIAAADNGIGITGVAPEASILSIRTGGGYYGDTSISLTAVVKAIGYAIEQRADVINLSVGVSRSLAAQYPEYINILYEAVRVAAANGITVVCAAGNTVGDDTDVFVPANMEETIAVGSVQLNNDGDPVSVPSSATGEELDLVAPGRDILTTGLLDDYQTCSGTSFSTPMVTGAIASLISLDKQYNDNTRSLTYSEIRQLLADSATDLGADGKDVVYGAGLLDVNALLNLYLRDRANKKDDQKEQETEQPVVPDTAEDRADEEVRIDLRDLIRYLEDMDQSDSDIIMQTLDEESRMLPHAYSLTILKEATPEQPGLVECICSHCGTHILVPLPFGENAEAYCARMFSIC